MKEKRRLKDSKQFSKVFIQYDQHPSEHSVNINFRRIIRAMKSNTNLSMRGSRVFFITVTVRRLTVLVSLSVTSQGTMTLDTITIVPIVSSTVQVEETGTILIGMTVAVDETMPIILVVTVTSLVGI